MAFEIEIKFRTDGHADVAQRVAGLGARPEPPFEQEDLYLAHPARDFAVTNEALRVRREGGSNRITYKGPRHEGPTKTREEIEITLSEGVETYEQTRRLWELLGFQPVALLHKRREPFHLVYQGRSVIVALDLSAELGAFVEIETMAGDPADLPAAQAAVLALGAELGLTEVEPRSYLRMALDRRALRNLPGQT
jgi:adenylate cyclase class 2